MFSDSNSGWLLKGGTGVLARVPDARATLDIDLVRSGQTLEQSLVELQRLSEIDLGDHFDQIADKVCATLASYTNGPSTVEKDLVDLIVFAETQRIESDLLSRALRAESSRRQLLELRAFKIPKEWGLAYTKLARSTPACTNYQTVEAAMELMNQFIDPVLRGEVEGKSWDPSAHQWQA